MTSSLDLISFIIARVRVLHGLMDKAIHCAGLVKRYFTLLGWVVISAIILTVTTIGLIIWVNLLG